MNASSMTEPGFLSVFFKDHFDKSFEEGDVAVDLDRQML